MITSIAFCFLEQLFRSATSTGLLDETDLELLEERSETIGNCFSDGEGSCCRRRLLFDFAIFIGFIGCCLSFSSVFSIFLALLLTSAFLLLLFYFLPLIVTYCWLNFVDKRFNSFHALLRQRELCLFSSHNPQNFQASLSPTTTTNSNSFSSMPLRQSRINCLRNLRRLVHSFHRATQTLISSTEERDKLFLNFIGDEMRSLAFAQEEEEGKRTVTFSECNNNFNNLHTSALKCLWQYMFLVRSEFLRVFLFASHRDLITFRPLHFLRHFYIFFRTFWQTFWFPPLSTNYRARRIKEGKRRRGGEGNSEWKTTTTTLLAICPTQLEIVLERFEEANNNLSKTGEWLPSEEFSVDVCARLQRVIDLVKNESGARNSKNPGESGDLTSEQQKQKLLEPKTGLAEEKEDEENVEKWEEEEEDYQIFELDPTTIENNGSVPIDDFVDLIDQRGGGGDDNCQEFPCSTSSHNAVIHELRHALTQRKEICLERELQALARLRGVPAEQIRRSELDRAPFATDGEKLFFSSSSSSEEKAKATTTPISHGAFRFASAMDSSDLKAILERRQAIFASLEAEKEEKDNKFFGGRGGQRTFVFEQQFGEEESEEEDEGEGGGRMKNHNN